MKFVKIIATAAILVAGASAANASALTSMLTNSDAIQQATSASVLTVNASEAKLLAYDNSLETVRARIQGNTYLLNTIERQGFTLDQIVGVSGGENDLTLYAL